MTNNDTGRAVKTAPVHKGPSQGKGKVQSRFLPAGYLAEHTLTVYRGDYIIDAGRRAVIRRRSIVRSFLYALIAGSASWWLFARPGRFFIRILAAGPLAVTAIVALGGAVLLLLRSLKQKDRAKVVLFGRHVFAMYELLAVGLVAISAGLGIFTALYSTHLDSIHDTRLLRADAVSFAYMAGCMSFVAHAVSSRPVFSVVYGRSRQVFHRFASFSRVLALVAAFSSVAELFVPASQAWMTVAVSLFLTSTGWEIARYASTERALNAIVQAAIEVESSARHGDGRLLMSLTTLESAISRRVLGRQHIIEREVAMTVRACLERLDAWEITFQDPIDSASAALNAELATWDDALFYDRVGRFAAVLRQSLERRQALVPGKIWKIEPCTDTALSTSDNRAEDDVANAIDQSTEPRQLPMAVPEPRTARRYAATLQLSPLHATQPVQAST